MLSRNLLVRSEGVDGGWLLWRSGLKAVLSTGERGMRGFVNIDMAEHWNYDDVVTVGVLVTVGPRAFRGQRSTSAEGNEESAGA